MYQYIQTIDITRINVYSLVIVSIQILCDKQYFAITDIVITRDYCNERVSCGGAYVFRYHSSNDRRLCCLVLRLSLSAGDIIICVTCLLSVDYRCVCFYACLVSCVLVICL